MGVILNAAAAPSHSCLQNNLVLRDSLANEEVCLPRALYFERRAAGKLYCLRPSGCPLEQAERWPRFLAIKSEGECGTVGPVAHFYTSALQGLMQQNNKRKKNTFWGH